MPAIIYCRVSSDPQQRGKSVEEQEIECRAFAASQGWTVGEVLVDNDRGASRYSRRDRPAYRRLSETLTKGDVLITWEASRAQRDLKAYIQLRDLCAERGVQWCYSGRIYDLGRGDDRFTTGLDALLSEKEVEQTRERVLRAVRANAAAGKPHGKLPYGYMIVRDPVTGESIDRVPNPETAPIVREIVKRVLAGESMYSLCKEFNANGIPGPRPRRDGTPAQWIPVTMRKIIESPTYAGFRTHKGEVVGRATWEPLITEDEHERMKALLANPTRLTHRGSEPRWLLTGIATCSVCGERMARLKNRGTDAYYCKERYCVSRSVQQLDQFVVENVLRRLESQDLLGDLDTADGALDAAIEQARALQQRLDAFTMSAADGELTPAALAKIEARLRPQIAAAEAQIRSYSRSPLIYDLSGSSAREKWLDLPIRERREVVQALVDIRVKPVGRGNRASRRLVSDGVELIWL
ncbi:recombinase family protein [Gordonia soli]|uniref:Putative recombinase n=1 Tax=Gordonia soli NBRC 108243 TaxID=1223545 RepID=M0QQZ4_9ACTN|nr:recombinase family protein [Gordonia soli]GAC71100.1 putative recombinase [Gordonia soli NBRC 108243]